MSDEWRPRFTVDVREELFKRVQDVIPRAMRKPLFEIILEDLVAILTDKTSNDREKILALIIDRQVSLTSVLPSLRK